MSKKNGKKEYAERAKNPAATAERLATIKAVDRKLDTIGGEQ